MAQSASSPKVEELRFRLKADPKSRLFYPLAEELRKIGQFTEAEQVLRGGLGSHPTYLSAWVSLGRVLRELKQDDGAIEALSKALTLDPGNVVAARLLADAYMARGDKLEAIKKYKLVHALLPSDQDLEALIARLDQELNPPPPPPPPPPAPEPEPPAFVEPELFEQTEPSIEPTVETPMPSFAPAAEEESPWGPPAVEQAQQALAREEEVAVETGDAEPMSAAHEESPFEEPGVEAGYGSDALTVEEPEGFQIASAPLAAELPEPVVPPETEEAEIFALATEAILGAEDTTETITMADLYARQGFTDDARKIYEHILQRDPENEAVRAKLGELERRAGSPAGPGHEDVGPAGEPALHTEEPETPEDPRSAKIHRLENWLAKVTRV
ncbi:MAG TPA: tetratricopeptide repeat protein [Thermoanaerobaculia bacterium]|jgi:tetratricopeptide (TPR) repeat protein|nr:tetratricopeptide repeat protein [Thermoanaerobaculia bacterium]